MKLALAVLAIFATTAARASIQVFNYYSYSKTGVQPWQLRCKEFTHLLWAFANIKADGTVTLESPPKYSLDNEFMATEETYADYKHSCPCEGPCLKGQLGVFAEMKQKCPHVKLILSIGGWMWSTNFSRVFASADSRAQAASTSLLLMQKYGFDGIDIDWEFPDFSRSDDSDYTTSRNDLDNLATFFEDARRIWKKKAPETRYLQTLAMRAFAAGSSDAWKRISNTIDYGLLMAYEYQHNNVRTRPGAAIRPPRGATEEEKQSNVMAALSSYIAIGFSKPKLVIGIPYYAPGWGGLRVAQDTPSGQTLGLGISLTSSSFVLPKMPYNMLSTLTSEQGFKRSYDVTTDTEVISNQTHVYFSENRRSVAAKAKIANDGGYAGVMMWNSNQDAVDEALSLSNAIALAAELDQGISQRVQCKQSSNNYCNQACKKSSEQGYERRMKKEGVDFKPASPKRPSQKVSVSSSDAAAISNLSTIVLILSSVALLNLGW